MGTQDPLVRIETATLAGGENNQDRYAYGDGWAFVLDGATSFTETPPVHDGGWYSERLKEALVPRLEAGLTTSTTDVVTQAIQEASEAHDRALLGPCPTSTIALARWDDRAVEVFVLGDSYALWSDSSEVTELTDDRLARIGQELRVAYQQRLLDGYGFDAEHRSLLYRLQLEQLRHRNKQGGYWIAGDYPKAAEHGVRRRIDREVAEWLILCTDGLNLGARKALGQGSNEITSVLELAAQEEREDPRAMQHPRAKIHDDKTAILVRFTQERN